jgi:plastocyanin
MSRSIVAASALFALVLFAASAVTAAYNASGPVYIHMNGGNHFLEPVVAVAPGGQVVFVSQDTGGAHTIVGFDPATGKTMGPINGLVQASKGGTVTTYAVRIDHAGVYSYYCSIHALLAKTLGSSVQPAVRPGVDGFKGAMAGVVIVTTDSTLLQDNPQTSHEKVVPGYFGG